MSFILNIENNKRLVFVHIPKNGGKSLIKSLEHLNPERPLQSLMGHLSFLETQKILGKKSSDFYFCISRNPWQRMVSYYNYISQKSPVEHGITDLHMKINSGMSFEEFVNFLIIDKRSVFRPQYEYVVDSNKEVSLEVLRLDTIEDSLNNFLIKHNLNKDFNMCKINTSTHSHYSSFYDSNDLIEKVAKFEKGIIDYHNYKFEKK